jgi:hypothetical protein
LQKAQKPLSAGCFIGFGHGDPPFRATARVDPARTDLQYISIPYLLDFVNKFENDSQII